MQSQELNLSIPGHDSIKKNKQNSIKYATGVGGARLINSIEAIGLPSAGPGSTLVYHMVPPDRRDF